MVKIQLSDNSKKTRNIITAAAGGYTPESEESKTAFGTSSTVSVPIAKNAQSVGSGIVMTQPQFFSPLHTPQTWQVASRRKEIYQWSRFYYTNDPKVAAGVDFYSDFSQNGFTLECKSKKVLKYFEHFVKKIKLNNKLTDISREYYLLGDVFPFLEIHCPVCNGSNRTKDGNICKHPDGSFKGIKVLNPDYIEVKDNPLSDEPEFYLMPDEELRLLVQRREPSTIYNKLPQKLIDLVSAGQPIPLSSRSISHLKHKASPYGTYGHSIVQRLFSILAYKTKLMTANWIVAERLILPIRVVKLGTSERPASEMEIQDVVNQLAAVANDPNLTIVTHHAFETEWIGATGKIHSIVQELEQIGKEILDGLMLNQAILNGDMASYSSAQVGIEILIRRLENWRNYLKEWVEENIFLPVAMMQGFVDKEETELLGETVYLYPKLKWNDLKLRDNTNKIQSFMQLYDKQLISAETLLNEVGLDYDVEVKKRREETVTASPDGMLGGGMGGGMDMGGGLGGGMPPMDMGGGMDIGGGLGGGMEGGMDMGGGMGEPGMASASANLPKIGKRGSKKQQDEQAPPPKQLKFTSLEQKMYKMLRGINAPHRLYGQFSVQVPGEQRPYMLDFAYPEIGVGIESDGGIWHQREDFKIRDAMRDQKLANVGWRILRFTDNAIEEKPDLVRDIIYKNILESVKQKKKASSNSENLIKYASLMDDIKEQKNNISVSVVKMKDGLGDIILIGEK